MFRIEDFRCQAGRGGVRPGQAVQVADLGDWQSQVIDPGLQTITFSTGKGIQQQPGQFAGLNQVGSVFSPLPK